VNDPEHSLRLTGEHIKKLAPLLVVLGALEIPWATWEIEGGGKGEGSHPCQPQAGSPLARGLLPLPEVRDPKAQTPLAGAAGGWRETG